MEIKLNYIAFFFMISGTLFWVSAYFLMIKQSFRDQSIAYPLLSNVANWSWEFIHTFIKPAVFIPSLISNAVWLLLNSIILYTYFKFTKRNRLKAFSEFVVLFCLMYFLMLKVDFWIDPGLDKNMMKVIYCGFISCLIHGLGLLYLLKVVKTTKGQSVPIATCTLLGSTGYVIEVALNPVHSNLQSISLSLIMLFALVILFIYRIELIKEKKRESVV